MISGPVRRQVGADTFEIGGGDRIFVAGEVPHKCLSLEDTVSMNIFHPTRPDFVNEGR
jgi:quercetin dioxygenase-like cupin family protein